MVQMIWGVWYIYRAGYLQTAYSFLLQAADYNLPEFVLEKAKYLRVKVRVKITS